MAVNLSNWSVRLAYETKPSLIDSQLTDFPACIILETDALQEAQSDGSDIRVTDLGETQFFDHEIQTINTSSGSERLVLWLKLPSVSSSSNTGIRIHWGNPNASDTQAPISLWTDYEAVYHMNGDFSDSTGQHGGTEKTTDSSNPAFSSVSGVIENGMDSPGAPNYVELGAIDGGWEALIEDDHSLQLWAKPDDGQPSSRQDFFGHFFEVVGGDAYIWALGIREDGLTGREGRVYWRNEKDPESDLKAVDESGDVTGEEDFFGDGAQPWTMIQFNLDFGDAGTSIYKNGEPRPVDNRADDIAGITPPTGWVGDGSNPLVAFAHWETEPSPKIFNFYEGAIDELRIRDGLISDAWARAEYENQNDATVGGFWQPVVIEVEPSVVSAGTATNGGSSQPVTSQLEETQGPLTLKASVPSGNRFVTSWAYTGDDTDQPFWNRLDKDADDFDGIDLLSIVAGSNEEAQWLVGPGERNTPKIPGAEPEQERHP